MTLDRRRVLAREKCGGPSCKRMFSPRVIFGALLALCVAFSPPALAVGPPDSAGSADAALRRGTLPNGFRYAVLPHAVGNGRISLRLIVEAGSLDERDDERGFAHFVEHMAFEGSRHYPPGELVRFLQRLGLDASADVNAATSFGSTVYQLDLPANRAAVLPEALLAMRDYADGVEFRPEEVARERGVVQSERRESDTEDDQLDGRELGHLYAGTLLPSRRPIGDAEQVEHATAEQLRAFYLRCYRPERMTLLVTGDVEGGRLATLVAENFSSLRAATPPCAPVVLAPPVAGGFRAHVDQSTLVESIELRTIQPRPADTPAGRAAALARSVVAVMIERRLKEQAALGPKHTDKPYVIVETAPDDRFMHYGLSSATEPENWPATVALFENELRRARTEGFDPAEWREAAAVILGRLRLARDTGAGQSPADLADEVAGVLIAGCDWHGPVAALAEAEANLAKMSEHDAGPALAAMLPPAALHLILTLPEVPRDGPSAVLAAYRASAARPLAPAAPGRSATVEFHYGSAGTPGVVAQRRRETDLRMELVTFTNGVRLNLRPSKKEPHRFRLSARFGRGLADLPKDRAGFGFLASQLARVCDLQRNTRAELERLLSLHAIDEEFDYDYRDGEFTLDLSGLAEELPFALRYLAAWLSDLKLDPSHWEEAKSQQEEEFATRVAGSTVGRAGTDAYLHMAGSDARVVLADGADAGGFADVSGWIRRRWLGGPVEIGLVGDLDADGAVAFAAASVGTLAARTAEPATPAERLTIRAKPYRNTSHTDIPDHAAAVEIDWPATDISGHRDYCALQLATEALVDRMQTKLRRELGATYSPDGGVWRGRLQPDFGFAWVDLAFEPKQAKALAEQAVAMADELARDGLTPEEFARMLAPHLAGSGPGAEDEWWLAEVLVFAQSRPEVLAEARLRTKDFAGLTLDEVNRAAAQHFHAAVASFDCVMPAK